MQDSVTDVSASKITTLCHEPGNHAVESRACISKALFACRKRSEVGGSLGDDIVVQLELDAAPGLHYHMLVSHTILSRAKITLASSRGIFNIEVGIRHDESVWGQKDPRKGRSQDVEPGGRGKRCSDL